MNLLATLRRSVVAALRPSGAPWAVGPALWAMGAAALIAGTGAIIGQLQLVGLAYLVFGYLLWPGARRFPAYAQLAGALESAHGYLREAVKPAAQRRHLQFVRADAYRLAHQARATAEAAVLEPPPVSSVAVRAIPVAIELEDTVDAITAVSSAVDADSDSTGLIEDVQRRLKHLDQAAVAVESSPVRRAWGRAESPSP